MTMNKQIQKRTMKRTGAWCLVMGITAVAVGVAVGVGNILCGADLLSKSK